MVRFALLQYTLKNHLLWLSVAAQLIPSFLVHFNCQQHQQQAPIILGICLLKFDVAWVHNLHTTGTDLTALCSRQGLTQNVPIHVYIVHDRRRIQHWITTAECTCPHRSTMRQSSSNPKRYLCAVSDLVSKQVGGSKVPQKPSTR